MITCKNCNTQFSADYKYCPNCGKSNETTTCATCFAQIPTSADYCPKCSTPVTHTVKCAHCGAMNAKTSKYCGNCAKALKTQFDVEMDVERIKAVIPMLREALEAREPEPVPELTKKELKAKKKMEKIAKKAGFTLVDPDEEEIPELTAEELIEALPECECDCDCECEDTPDPVVELLKAQNENLEKVIATLKAEKEEKAAAPAAPAFPFYPMPMPMYQPAPQAAPAAPAAPQPIIIQQPAPAAPAAPQIIIQQADGTTKTVGAPEAPKSKKELKAEKKAAKKAKKEGKPRKHRLAGLFMLLFSGAYLAALWFLPALILPAADMAGGPVGGIDLARAIFALGGESTAMIAGETAIAAKIAALDFATADGIMGTLTIVSEYVICAFMTLSVLFAALDVVFSLFRVLTGKAKKRRGFCTRMSFLLLFVVILAVVARAAIGATDIVGTLLAVVTSFMEEGAAHEFTVLGMGAVAGFAALLLRQFVNCFIRKSK